jgi:hypothetical protein
MLEIGLKLKILNLPYFPFGKQLDPPNLQSTPW